MRHSYSLAVVAAAAVAAVAHAELPRMPDGSPLPDKPVMMKGLVRGKPDPVWVAYEGTRGLFDAKRDARPVSRPVAFLEELYWAAAWPKTDRGKDGAEYLLLVTVTKTGEPVVDEYIGWVNVNYIVRQPEAIKNPLTHIHTKAMIVNTLQTIKSNQVPDVVPVRKGPATSAALLTPFRLFNVFFVYAQVGADGSAASQARGDGFSLLGFKPERGNDPIAGVVAGWVENKYLCLWTTAEAIEYDLASRYRPATGTARPRAVAYRSKKDAEDALKGQRVEPLSEEEEAPDPKASDWPPRPPGRYHYPLLESSNQDGNTWYRAGIVGPVVGEGGARTVKGESDRLRAVLANLERRSRQTDVLFVVSDKQSMKEWYGSVVPEAVQKMLALVNTGEDGADRTVRAAVAFYNTKALPGRIKGGPLRKITDRNPRSGRTYGDELLHSLRTWNGEDGQWARAEVFKGVIRGIEDAQFDPYAQKMVVLIGDFGDHADGDFGEADVAQALLTPKYRTPAKEALPIHLYALQVVDPVSVSGAATDDALAFRQQVEKVRDRVHASSPGTRVDYMLQTQSARARDAILVDYREAVAKAKEIEATLERWRRGQFLPGEFRENATRFTVAMQKMIREFGIDLATFAGGVEIFQEGYVWEREPKNGPVQVRERVLLRAADLDVMIKLLSHFQPQATENASPQSVVVDAIGGLAGENPQFGLLEGGRLRPEIDSTNQAVRRATGVRVRSPFLNKRINQLNPKDWDEVTEKELMDLNLKWHKLTNLRAGVYEPFPAAPAAVPKPNGPPDKVWRASGPKAATNRAFTLEISPAAGAATATTKDVIYYWIDPVKEWP